MLEVHNMDMSHYSLSLTHSFPPLLTHSLTHSLPWLPELINVFSEISEIPVFKCFLCACAANDAGREMTGGPPQELDAKRLVYNIPNIYILYLYIIMFNLKSTCNLRNEYFNIILQLNLSFQTCACTYVNACF